MDLAPLTEAVKTGDRNTAKTLTTHALAEQLPPDTILNAMITAMDDVGERFKRHEAFVPEMLIAARAMKEALAILEPELVRSGFKPIATAVIGTVQGDLHDIGKNLVAMMWKGANLNVIDLGTNITPETFITAAKQHHAQLIGLSSLLTTTMPGMKTTVETIRADAELNHTKVIVGGAPVTAAFAEEIHADAYAPDAASAVAKARELLTLATA